MRLAATAQSQLSGLVPDKSDYRQLASPPIPNGRKSRFGGVERPRLVGTRLANTSRLKSSQSHTYGSGPYGKLR